MNDPAYCISTGGHQYVTTSTLKQQHPPPSYYPGFIFYTVLSWWETVTRCIYCGVES
ncbi:MAG: hypothetical protein KGJ23_08495 [Euryarchaeota archaeon]|nr:hypothetical protein [Euryarchaeota archaeon]MDE1836641.1 hypothetical protein [Euryarchaeota archaeon]MDE1879164.1 hypothetical protein [Euryarchaeota archaeon]MDE2044611.1 hypothetical protein [Thermoplasmata archaeon]